MSGRAEPLSLSATLALGVLQGPAELLPVSSSAHIAMVPWLLGGQRAAGDGEREKALEVALHTGSALALLIAMRHELGETLRALEGRRAAALIAASAPPAVAGYLGERQIERRLGGPWSTAAGLAGGAVAMVLADLRPQRRQHDDAGVLDGLWLGLAQACALVPGVSRSGATLVAARWRGFRRADAAYLSRLTALPIISGATALKLVRLRRGRLSPSDRVCLLAGTAAAFASTLGARRLVDEPGTGRGLAPYALYRLAFAAVIARVAQRRSWGARGDGPPACRRTSAAR